jgi:AGCS family alanine or glycine:cation symporter
MGGFTDLLSTLNGILWHDTVLFALLGTGILFTVWSGFSQYRALTHGTAVVRGAWDDPDDPGAINHFQALSAALSATVGLGNIGGVALAISLGGPGAVFWMWVVGVFGMAIKMTEVTLSMLYRNTEDEDNPHGGPMWVASKGIALMNPKLAWLGGTIGTIFCLTLLISTATGGNMFQAFNVGLITYEYFGVPSWITGVILAVIVALVIIGGIKRIGRVAGLLVPFMVVLYLACGIYVLVVNAGEIPAMFALIVKSAFAPTEASGAFIGGTAGAAFLFGMKRALFSNEAGQGSSPIAHSAAKTDEPVREGIVAGLEPFIDTIVVCTFTALIILSTGVWNRAPDVTWDTPLEVTRAGNVWEFESRQPPVDDFMPGDAVTMVVIADENPTTGFDRHEITGIIVERDGLLVIDWNPYEGATKPEVLDDGFHQVYLAAVLTGKAFDEVQPGLGKWLVSLAAWLFAISTMISWSYYGEQAMVYLAGEKSVLAYKVVFCALIIVATLGIIKTDAQLDNLTGVGSGVMLIANLPIMWIFGRQAMRAYHDYIDRMKAGLMGPDHPTPTIEDLISGRDVVRKDRGQD